jgi:fatty acid-binding protein DegV
VLPTTSQPSPEAFANLYADCRAKGEQAVVLTVSSKLSGTYQSAHIAAIIIMKENIVLAAIIMTIIILMEMNTESVHGYSLVENH